MEIYLNNMAGFRMRMQLHTFGKWMRILFFGVMLTLPAFAQLSPGDLQRAHASLEGLENCTQCHSAGKKVSAKKCLSCHTILKDRIDAGKGLHSQPEFKKCVKCHSEHHGRNFKLIHWQDGRKHFDHSKTGYELKGAHTEQECRDCHQPKNIVIKEALLSKKKDLKRTFLGLDQKCVSCHIDEHRGQLSNDCLKCHNMEKWKPATAFDHNRTDYPLTGKHVQVDCQKCHKPIQDNLYPDDRSYLKFTNIRFNQCSACHEDAHNGQFGKECNSCHQTDGWRHIRTANFNHDRTRFPLRGLHRKVACESCHKPGLPRKGLKFAHCMDCHEDFHNGQFADHPSRGDCDECHTVNGFHPSTFTLEQHQKSDFPLEGAHLAIPCIACHQTQQNQRIRRAGRSMLQMNRFVFTSTKCHACHEDPHQGEVDKFVQEGGCEFCHSVESWQAVQFDHQQTDFALKGHHRETDCVSCHKPEKTAGNQRIIRFADLSTKCQDCHQDVHHGQFESTLTTAGHVLIITDCSRCHTEENWQPDKFDHNRDAAFSLEGAHQSVPCLDCHKKVGTGDNSYTQFKPLDNRCSSCHGNG